MSVTAEKFSKAKESVLNTVEEAGLENPKAQVILVEDFSGSMRGLYESGFVQKVFERMVPIALALDDDGEMPVYIFNSSYARINPDVNVDNIDDYVKKEICAKHSYGSTKFSGVLKAIRDQFLRDNAAEVKKEGGIFSKLFGSKSKATPQITAELPTLVLFYTDGDCDEDDKEATTKLIIELSKYAIFVCFIGLTHTRGVESPYLKKVHTIQGSFIRNTSYDTISEEAFGEMSDDDLYKMIFKDFPGWYQEAKDKDLFKEPEKEAATTDGK